MEKSMTRGREWRLILLFSLPIMAGQLLQQLYNTVDGIVVGNFISSAALSAVGSCTTLSFVFLAVAMGMGNGCGIVVAQLYGAGEHGEMRRAASTALLLFLGLGVVFTALGLVLTPFIMRRALGIADEEICSQAIVYFRIYSLGLIFQFVYNAISSILRSVGDSRATLYFLLVSTLANIVLDLLLVAVLPWGVAGAAIATVLAQAACAAVSWIYMRRRHECFRFSGRELVFDVRKLVLCLKMGILTTVQQLVVSCGHLLLQRLVNSFGPVTMAAYTVGVRFDMYIAVPTTGFFSGMAAFAGQNTGAGRPDRVKRGLGAAMLMSFGMVAILSSLVYIFAVPLARLFGVEDAALTQSVEFMRFISIFYPLFALYLPINGTLQGCGDPAPSLIAALLALGGRVCGSYAMAYAFNMGYSSCWRSCVVGWTLALCFAGLYFMSGRWRTRGIARAAEQEV